MNSKTQETLNNASLEISGELVYRMVGNELVVVELDSGNFLHFSPETKEILDFFHEPRTLQSLFSVFEDQLNEEKVFNLKKLCNELMEFKILIRTKRAPKAVSYTPKTQGPFKFLRQGSIKLDQLNFFC